MDAHSTGIHGHDVTIKIIIQYIDIIYKKILILHNMCQRSHCYAYHQSIFLQSYQSTG